MHLRLRASMYICVRPRVCVCASGRCKRISAFRRVFCSWTFGMYYNISCKRWQLESISFLSHSSWRNRSLSHFKRLRNNGLSLICLSPNLLNMYIHVGSAWQKFQLQSTTDFWQYLTVHWTVLNKTDVHEAYMNMLANRDCTCITLKLRESSWQQVFSNLGALALCKGNLMKVGVDPQWGS